MTRQAEAIRVGGEHGQGRYVADARIGCEIELRRAVCRCDKDDGKESYWTKDETRDEWEDDDVHYVHLAMVAPLQRRRAAGRAHLIPFPFPFPVDVAQTNHTQPSLGNGATHAVLTRITRFGNSVVSEANPCGRQSMALLTKGVGTEEASPLSEIYGRSQLSSSFVTTVQISALT
jgi:hypothetical protein